MIASAIALITGWGVPRPIAKLLLFMTAATLALIILAGAKKLYDRSVVDKHDAKVEAEQHREDRKADEKASEQRRIDDARNEKERQELNDVIKANPDPAERKRAYYRCIELQRAARQNGQQPPSCG
jgi:hypothetical protein